MNQIYHLQEYILRNINNDLEKTEMLTSRKVGSLTEYFVKNKLTVEGFEVVEPFKQNSKTDLVVIVKSIPVRIQVKTAILMKGENRFRAELRRRKDTKGNRVKYENDDVDFFLVKCKGIECYYVFPYYLTKKRINVTLRPYLDKNIINGIDLELYKNRFSLIWEFVNN